MPKQKKAAAKPELKIKVKPELKVTPKQLDQMSKNGKKVVQTKTKVDVFAKTAAKASSAKPVQLKLPRPLKKAARACAKDQGLKLRAWIVELIKTQLTQAAASTAENSLQTL